MSKKEGELRESFEQRPNVLKLPECETRQQLVEWNLQFSSLLYKTKTDFPTCEKCEVFLNKETKTSVARAIFCEGLRATDMCPKDKWVKKYFGEPER